MMKEDGAGGTGSTYECGRVKTEKSSDRNAPFGSWPEQIGPQDDGDVTGRHLVYGLLLRQQRQELDQVPDREREGKR